jgi:NADPH:quinone reductase-like Zn-dependent oxidoreductase
VVVAVGPDVTRVAPDEEVFGIGKGSFAEYMVAPEHKLAPKPSSLTFEQAAALPVSGLTARQGLCDIGRLWAGQRVLVIGASGGVGMYAVQIAKALGAEVIGVCSTSKVGLVASIGADHVLDYTREDFAESEQTYDLILDIAGNAPLARLRRALAADGTLVIAGGESAGRWLGGLDRQLRALALVAVRRAAADDVRVQGALRGTRAPGSPRRRGRARAGHRTDVCAERHAAGDVAPRERAGARQARHHPLSATAHRHVLSSRSQRCTM